MYNTIGLEYTPYLKTGIYHPVWNLKDERSRIRYEQETPKVKHREVYVSDIVVCSEKANLEFMQGVLDRAGHNPAK